MLEQIACLVSKPIQIKILYVHSKEEWGQEKKLLENSLTDALNFNGVIAHTNMTAVHSDRLTID